jgi:hypothetical protein
MRFDLGSAILSPTARVLAMAAGLCAFAASALAASVTVDFNGLDGGRDGINVEGVDNFYRGGRGSLGSGPGPNFGITFSDLGGNSAPFAICNDRGLCNDAAVGNSLFVFGNRQNNRENPGVVIHIEGGFRGIVEFDVSISNLGPAARLAIKTERTDLSNIVIDNFQHPDLQDTCFRLECEFVRYTFNLADDPFTPDDVVAHDIIISTDRIDALFIDNIIFHDLILPDEDTPPVAVAEPSSALMAAGAGLIAAMLRRRRTARIQSRLVSSSRSSHRHFKLRHWACRVGSRFAAQS